MLALKIVSVSHSFGAARVLNNVSFDVPEGTFTALLGVNGAGKTTLFNLITRLYDTRTGAIEICGHEIRQASRHALAAMGIVFQSRALDANLSVMQNLFYAAALHGIGKREAKSRAELLLARLGLSDKADSKVRALSGGQARRAEVARAMMHAPRLLLCDEATAGLDIEARRTLVDEVHRLATEDGVGVLWATHLTDEILPEDQVIVLHKGSIIATGSTSEIAGDSDLAAAFLTLTHGAPA